ncbi:MAG: 5-deoxy-glucuronate isomerase [Ilumatobacteraceae bacterium]
MSERRVHVVSERGAGWLHRAGSLRSAANTPVDLSPARAGWQRTGLRVEAIAAGASISFDTGTSEMVVLPLSGAVDIEVDGETFALRGRPSVFAATTDWAYLPIDADVRIASTLGAEIALPSAYAERRFPAVRIAADDVPIEIRGAGPATRQVNPFMAPGVFDGADRLMCVELLTPGGNWSSYPPHRHDDSPECPVNNEEVYYFRIGRDGSTEYAEDGFGLHRTYTPDGAVDVTVDVHDGDVFCVHRGYHGPCVAAPGYPMYYLNVLAGAGGERSMAFCDDPTHHWQRDEWDGLPIDPRCPMVTADGVCR